MRTAQSKILSADALARALQLHRSRGEKVVFANGCFDTLHVGHTRYLQAARGEGDVLVVAVNSDPGVRLLKGDGRPILDEGARASLVAAQSAVDYVVLFGEPDVGPLLRLLRPDVHAKGTDYTPDTVPEREVARELGIRVAIVGDAKEHSTRGMLDSIRKGPHA